MSSNRENTGYEESSDDYVDDDTYFQKNAKFADFLSMMDLEGEGSKKRSRKHKEDDVEEEYEKKPRHSNQMEEEEYLPTIEEDGKLRVNKKPRIQKKDVESDEEEPTVEKNLKQKMTKRERKEQRRKEKKKEEELLEEDEELLGDNNEVTEETPLTPEELKEQKEKHYTDSLTDIAVNCELILENPSKGVTRHRNEISPLNKVLIFARDTDPRIRQVALLSLMKVFNDILPNYPIHLASKEEKETQISKDVRKMRQYEESLMTFYQSYLKMLIKLSKEKSELMKKERLLSIRCLCGILSNHYQFNLAETICKSVVPFIVSSDETIANIVADCFDQVFKGDVQGSVTYSIVQQMAHVMKAKNYRIPPRAIQVFLSLPLKSQLSEEDELGVKSKKKKKLSEVLVWLVDIISRDKIMQESEGPNLEVFQAFQKDTLQEVLLIYFRILKLDDNTRLIHVVLEGLATFSHLLNSRIIIDLLDILKKIMQEKTLSLESTLQCVLASLRLIHLVSSIISIDEGIFITKLYSLRFDLIKVQNHKFIPDFLECIDLSFLNRKELLHERVAAYSKALTTMALQLPTKYAMACISLARALLIRYPMYSSLVDNEEGRRISGVYSLSGDIPDQVNAHAATLWELRLLQKHYDPTVATFAKEMEASRSLRMDQQWREILKKDYSHKIFSSGNVMKKRVVAEEDMNEEDLDELLDQAFGSD